MERQDSLEEQKCVGRWSGRVRAATGLISHWRAHSLPAEVVAAKVAELRALLLEKMKQDAEHPPSTLLRERCVAMRRCRCVFSVH